MFTTCFATFDETAEAQAKSTGLVVREAGGAYRSATAQEVLRGAEYLLLKQIDERELLDNAPAVKQFLRVRMGLLDHEEFAVLYLDTRHRLIEVQNLFRGTLNQTSVYPREVVTQALRRKASAVIFAHNHPSGIVQPSRADETLTQTLKAALALVDVRVLDHVVVGPVETFSMSEHGLV